ncbi:hypothetical protein [Streptomyces sp. NRRL B-24484]|uniref:hypothetical protein n=1 Tax=Streptomyces sp. NRRL B-24484 TaxID=1463833 RepID=UPI0004BEDF58|nr:hypothetical protein [Streptomyces sp. NRRL B-24484]
MAKRRTQQVGQYDAPTGWQLWHHPDLESDGWECLLYSDSNLLGTPENIGPFTLYTTGIPAGQGDQPTGQLVLRIPHADSQRQLGAQWSLQDATRRGKLWLGAGPDEEVAALLSLSLNIRLRSGGLVRRFPHGSDPAGVPEMHGHHVPGMVPAAPYRIQLPALRGSLQPIGPGLEFLAGYSRLDPTSAFVLAKAARQYADALWVAVSDPEQAWLQLVTALEAVAVHVQAEADPVETFRQEQPKAASVIEALDGGQDALPKVAKEFARLLGAGRRVRDFVDRYRPEVPEHRPQRPQWRVDWTQLDTAIKKIYGFRSKLLHEGQPLPPAMAVTCVETDDNGALAESPSNDTIHGSGNAAWEAGAVPMHLWMFAHIVRGCLLNWFTEQTAVDEPGGALANCGPNAETLLAG